MRRSLKKLPQNGEKASQSKEKLHNAIYVNFHKTELLSFTQIKVKLYLLNYPRCSFVLKGPLASLLLDTTQAADSCLLLLNIKQ